MPAYKVRPPSRSVNDELEIRRAIVYRSDDSSGWSRRGASPPSLRRGGKGRVPRSEMDDSLIRHPYTPRAAAMVALHSQSWPGTTSTGAT